MEHVGTDDWAPRALIKALSTVISRRSAPLAVYPQPVVSLNGRWCIEVLLNATPSPPHIRTIFLLVNDHELEIASEPSSQVLLRTSMRRSLRRSNELILPWTDPVLVPFPPLPRYGQPIVGFCGRQNRWRHDVLAEFVRVATLSKRRAAGAELITNFSVKKSWWGAKRDDAALAAEFTVQPSKL